MQIICVDQAAQLPLRHQTQGLGLRGSKTPGEHGREPRERRAGTSSQTPASTASAGPAPPPAPPPSSLPHAFLRPSTRTPPPVQPPLLPSPPGSHPLPRPPPPVQGGDGGTGGDRREANQAQGYGRGARRVCAARRPRPAPGFQHRGQRHRHERAKPGPAVPAKDRRRHQAFRGADPARAWTSRTSSRCSRSSAASTS